jgi:hypothetical protein
VKRDSFHAAKSKEGEGSSVTGCADEVDGKWLIASIREFADDPPPTPHERLQTLSWLVGDWVDEGTAGASKISYRWAEDQNFLLGDIQITIEGKLALKSTQRIGWDPLAGKVARGCLTPTADLPRGNGVDDGWVIKSSTVNPDGSTGSATITVTVRDKDHFTMKGTERIVGDAREPDFEFEIVRRPPVATK